MWLLPCCANDSCEVYHHQVVVHHPGLLLLTCFCGCLQKKNEAAEYHKILTTRLREQRERRSESLAKKRALRMASQASRDEAKTGRTPAS